LPRCQGALPCGALAVARGLLLHADRWIAEQARDLRTRNFKRLLLAVIATLRFIPD